MKPLAHAFCRYGWLVLGATACVAPSRVMPHLPSAVNQHQLPPLEPAVEMGELNNVDGTTPDDLLLLFQNEVCRNLAEPNGMPTVGTAQLEITGARMRRTGRALQVLQLSTLLLPSLVGVPLESYQTTLTARVQIRDVQGLVLGDYEGHGTAQARVAMYYGFGQQQAAGVSNALALRMALAEIRQQLNHDAPRLSQQLLAANQQAAPGPTGMSGTYPSCR